MKACTMLLARGVAFTPEGVDIVGAGGNVYDSPTFPCTVHRRVLVLLEAEPHDLEGKWPGKLRLMDEDGQVSEKTVLLVLVKDRNTAFSDQYAMNIARPGRYRLELWRDGQSLPIATATFDVGLIEKKS